MKELDLMRERVRRQGFDEALNHFRTRLVVVPSASWPRTRLLRYTGRLKASDGTIGAFKGAVTQPLPLRYLPVTRTAYKGIVTDSTPPLSFPFPLLPASGLLHSPSDTLAGLASRGGDILKLGCRPASRVVCPNEFAPPHVAFEVHEDPAGLLGVDPVTLS